MLIFESEENVYPVDDGKDDSLKNKAQIKTGLLTLREKDFKKIFIDSGTL